MDQKKNTIQSWLDKLQQESWQLELIISSILLLIIGSYDDKIPDLILKYNTRDGFNFAYVVAMLIPLLVFIKSNLIVHIFLRGLWIGCIGLRYLSADIDYNSFNYADRFDRFLKRKVIPFDVYIERLERICSIIFSYSFLMVFHFISFCLVVTIIQGLNYFGWSLVRNTFLEPILGVAVFVLTLSAVLNFIDFVTIGKLKKAKYGSILFYPFYRIYNVISLAFLYRPIHYNFISNKLGRTYMLLMLPYMFFLAIIGNEINYHEYLYIPKKENGANWVIENNYDGLREGAAIKEASIEKLFYDKEEPIKLFLRVEDNGKTNDLIKEICPDLNPYERHNYSVRPFNALKFSISDKYHNKISRNQHNQRIDNSLSCMSQIYNVSLDSSLVQSLDYVFYQHPNSGERGLLTGISIDGLQSGKHKLVIEKKVVKNNAIDIGKTIEIPFFIN